MKGKYKKIVLLVVLCFFSTLVLSDKVSAVANSSGIMKKWIFTQYYACVRSMGDPNPNMKRVVEREDSGSVVKSLFKGGSLALPSYNFGHSLGDTKLSCEENFVGKSLLGKKVTGASEYGGGFGGAGYVKWDNLGSSQGFLEKLGYELESTGDGEKMFTISTQKSSVTNVNGNSFETDWGGVSTLVIVAKKNNKGKFTYSIDGWDNLWDDTFSINLTKDKFEIKLKGTAGLAGNACTPSGSNEEIVVKLNENDVDAFLEDLKDKLDGVIWRRTCSNYTIVTNESYRFNANSVDSGDVGNFVYAKDKNPYDVSNDVIEAMSGMNIAGLKLTNSEFYVLYTHYINNFLPDDGAKRVSCDSDASGVEVKLKDVDGEFKQCHINTSGLDLSVTVYTQAFDGRLRQPYPWITTITIQGIINWLRTVDTDTLTDVPTPTSLNPGHGRNDGNNDGDSSQACYSGAGPLGWILCPIIKGITGLGTVLWNDVEQNHLKTPAKEIFADGGGVQNVWNAIRDIGNIVFVILFMIVIFSQLTGVGIDNYGIKKILPKLVLVAVLTNLSWIICELAVDLSNIVGSGINSLLTGMAPKVDIATESGSSVATAAVLEIALAGGGIALFAWLNPIGLVSAAFAVLGMVLSILAGIAVMYVVLLIREAGIVLLVCLAPVAIVGYALPNTEKLSKKWLSLFKALLIVYPICGLVMGGGKLAGAVLASVNSESTGMKLAAMIIQVLPFFLIPMILKKSLSLMGNVGARLSQVGRGLSRRTSGMIQGGVKNSERFKNWAGYQQNKRTLREANRIKNKYAGRSVDSMSEKEQHLAAWGNKTAASLENQKARNRMLADSKMGYDSEIAYGTAALANEREKKYSETFANMANRGMVEKEFKEAINGNDAEKASAAFKELINQGGIEQAMDILSGDSVWDEMKKNGTESRIIQAMGSSKVDAFKAYNKYRSTGGTAAFKDWYKGNLSREQLEKDKARGVKNQTYAEHLMRKESDSMVNLDKDEIKFMSKNAPIAGELDGKQFDSSVYHKMVAQAMLKSGDAEVRTIASDMFCKGIENGGDDYLAKAGFTTGSFEKMRGKDAEAIVNSYTKKHGGDREAALKDIRGQLSTQIANAQKDPGALRNMDNAVLDMLGLKKGGNGDSGNSTSGSNNTNPNGTNFNADANANAGRRNDNAGGARRSGFIEDSGYREYNKRRTEPVAPAPQNYASVLPSIQGKTYGEAETSGVLPTWVQNELDYRQLTLGADASKALTEINGKSFEEARDSGVLPTWVDSEQGYRNYARELGAQVQDTSNLKQYRTVQSKTYEEAKASGDAPEWVQDAQDYDRFVAGAEASVVLPKIEGKTYEQAKDSGVLPERITNEDEFNRYSSELRIKKQDADSIRQYRAIEGKTYEQARDSGVLPGGIGRAEYEQFNREYKIQFNEARMRGANNSAKPVGDTDNNAGSNDGSSSSGDFDVPR